jgi:hypothetical protein
MEEKSTLTSRSIAVILITITLIALSALVPAKWLGVVPKKQLKPKLDLSSVSYAEQVATDSNHDGVVSWGEVMNDTLKPSSSTLEELKKIPIDQKEIDNLNDPNNLTSSFAKNLYLAGAYFDKNGITDETSKQEALAKLMQDEKSKIVPTTYSYKDFNVAKAESKDSIRVYGNTVALILENIITEKSAGDDIVSINSFTKSKDVKDLIPLKNNKGRLDDVVQKLLKVSVPPSAIIFHIITINRVAAYRDLITSLSNADKDPLRATFVIENYTNTAIATLRTYLQLSDYFNGQNIIFSSKEKGYVFTAGYSKTN